ncbi:MAG: DUF362 domain-containing protein [Candidatus Fermentibacteria bacterium]
MRTKVYFLPIEMASAEDGFIKLLDGIIDRNDLKPTDTLAVKIHPGEEGNTSYVSPDNVNRVIKALCSNTDRIFLTDTTVLYPGKRMSAPDYLRLTHEHGFGLPWTPPFIIADGLRGGNEVTVRMPEDFQTDEAHIASIISSSDAMVVISHFKGHLLTGFGGTLKNLGMGCASRAGKLYQHSSVKPLINTKKCTACGICAGHCHVSAISINSHASIDTDICTGCGECLGRCPEGAVRVSWDQNMNVFMRRMIEYAYAALSVSNPLLYVNFVTSVVPDCDCMKDMAPPFVDDIGILASIDPVAIDMASLDLVTAAPAAKNSPVRAGTGADKFRAYRPDIDGILHLSIAESLGLGSMEYELVRIT